MSEYASITKANQFLFNVGNLLFFMAVIHSIILGDFTFNFGILTTLWVVADFCILTQLIDVGLFPKKNEFIGVSGYE